MTDLPEPDIRASIEAWPITCDTCGRAFLVVPDDPNEPVIYDTVSGTSEPGAIQCECGAEIWLEAEPGGWRPWQLMTIGGRPILSAPDRLPTSEEADRILIEAGYNPAEVAERMNAVARRALRSRYSWPIRLLIRLLQWLESSGSPGQK